VISIEVALVYIPTYSVSLFLSLVSSLAFVVCFLDDSHFDRVRWNLNVVLIFTSFMAKDVDHLFMYLLDICTSSSENCLFNSYAHLLIELFFCCLTF
jgi:hypothetical protein